LKNRFAYWRPVNSKCFEKDDFEKINDESPLYMNIKIQDKIKSVKNFSDKFLSHIEKI